MKKVLMTIVLIASSVAVQAQTSRMMFGLGGGVSMNVAKGDFVAKVSPMATFNFGYAILDSVGENASMGFRTGLNATYSRIGLAVNIVETFTNTDYYGSPMEYTVNCSGVNYMQQHISFEVPIMLAINAEGAYVNLGAKLLMPTWNKYEQRIGDAEISVYYRDLGVTIVNDPSTGMLTADQTKMSGVAALPRLYIGLSAEIGYLWNLSGNNKLGFDIFVDYIPWGFFGSTENNKQLVEVSPIVNDCEQPKASVNVNPLSVCNQFNMQCLNAGLKIVYSFDMNHAKKGM